MNSSRCRYLSFFLPVFLLVISAQAQQPCEDLASLKIPHLTITSAKALPAGWELPAQTGFINTPAGMKVAVPFCRIEAVSKPSSDSHIGIEVWLPVAANWNGRLLGIGNPGFIGSIARAGLAGNVQRGKTAAGCAGWE